MVLATSNLYNFPLFDPITGEKLGLECCPHCIFKFKLTPLVDAALVGQNYDMVVATTDICVKISENHVITLRSKTVEVKLSTNCSRSREKINSSCMLTLYFVPAEVDNFNGDKRQYFLRATVTHAISAYSDVLGTTSYKVNLQFFHHHDSTDIW